MLDLDIDDPSDRAFNLVGVLLLLLLLFRIFLLSFFGVMNMSHPTHHLPHPTHHVQVYKYSVPVKDALDLTNNPVTLTAIHLWLKRQRNRDSDAAAAEAAEAAMCTFWSGRRNGSWGREGRQREQH